MKTKNLFKIYLIIAFLCIIPHLVTGQSQPSSPLPLDPQVRTGKLANGFTYFIRRNTNPKDRVIFYLANKVGSILEDEDQQGLAHFMEHMNFNGTVNFPKNALVDYLQKAGVRFGADINAYTSFDETVYQLPLPSNKPEIVNNGIQIMRDWAQGATLEPAEIERERGIILEEKRLGKGSTERMQRQYIPVLFNNSRYSARLPIGSELVVKNFKPEVLQRFFKDWYRPNLQALIVVGDIDVDQIEATLKQKFSDLKNPDKERLRTKYAVPLTNKNQFVAVTDKEMSQTILEVIIKKPERLLKTEDDYKAYIAQQLFNSMLRDRYRELSEKENVAFISGSAGINSFTGGLSNYSASVVAKPGETEMGFKSVWRETERLKRWGFTAKELDRAKTNLLKRLQTSLKEKNTAYSPNFVNEYLQYFLKGSAAPGIEVEYRLAQQKLPEITLATINVLARFYITDTNRDIVIMAPEKDKINIPSELTVLKWMADVQKEKLNPYQDGFIDEPLLTTQPIAGKIAKQKALDGISAQEILLSNGARVILKPTKFFDNQVLFKVFSPGGSSLYSDAEFQSAAYAAYLTAMAGLGKYNFSQLNKFVSGNSIAISPYVSDYSEGVQGAAASDELEILLQMTYLYFTSPKIDSTVFKNFVAQSKASLANKKDNPNRVFDDTISAVMGNYNVRRTGTSLEKIDQIDLKKAFQIFKERFSDASGFTFSFVGDFDIEKIKPLLEKYIASLPSTYKNEQPKDLGIHPLAGKIAKTVYKGIDQKATVRLNFNNDYQYSSANNLLLEALSEVLKIRLIERLREDEGGVYSPSVYVRYAKVPAPRYSLTVTFGCAPENVEKLIASTLDEVAKLKTLGATAINIDKFKAEYSISYQTNLRKNDFWSGYITDQILNNEDLNEINKTETYLSELNSQQIREAAKLYLSTENFIRLVLMPEK